MRPTRIDPNRPQRESVSHQIPAGRTMNQQDAIVSRFAPLHPKRIDLSLGRIERLLADLGAPHENLPPVIHVAGTNGKGSTIAFMRAALEAAGKRVHVYTSPHLIRFNERIRLAGELVGDERMFAAFDRCEAVNAGQAISVFEITTAAAFLLFNEIPADYLLLEVGLGGRYDATNVIGAPVATIITPVSMDHPEFLGETVEKIAYEKAGILKRGAPARGALSVGATSRCMRKTAAWCSRTPLAYSTCRCRVWSAGISISMPLMRSPPCALSNLIWALASSSAAWRKPIGRRGCNGCAKAASSI
jgi:folylpolyglutamate synthase/dihydropteroate synthase